jgi:membrane protein DedA with SNARE-associated domain
MKEAIGVLLYIAVLFGGVILVEHTRSNRGWQLCIALLIAIVIIITFLIVNQKERKKVH